MELYSDKRNVVESLTEAVQCADEGQLQVLDTDAVVVAQTDGHMKERNLWSVIGVGDRICTIEWEDLQVTTSLELHFHESVVTETLELTPAGPHAIGAEQATRPTELSEILDVALTPLVDERDAIFTFAGVEAGSMANGGHYCDFEYQYSIDGTDF